MDGDDETRLAWPRRAASLVVAVMVMSLAFTWLAPTELQWARSGLMAAGMFAPRSRPKRPS